MELARANRRSERSRQAILDATFELFEEVGYKAITIEAIAARAGVGKQTIYRWWGSKSAVTLDAFLSRSKVTVTSPTSGSAEEIMVRHTEDFVDRYIGTALGRRLAELIGEAQSDRDVAEQLQTRWMQPRRAPVIAALRAAQERGDLDPDLDVEVLLDTLYGALQYRRLLGHAPVTKDFARSVVRLVLDGARAGGSADGQLPLAGAEEAGAPADDGQDAADGGEPVEGEGGEVEGRLG